MAYRLMLETHSVEGLVRAVDLLRRLDISVVALQAARRSQLPRYQAQIDYEAPTDAIALSLADRAAHIADITTSRVMPLNTEAAGNS